MAVDLSMFCKEIRNWFDKERYFGTFEVKDGVFNMSGVNIAENQYYRIVGSVFNDGVYKHPATGLTDEVFDGAVWTMAVPQGVLDLLEEINAWVDKYANDAQANGPYTSESFGGYSYTKAGGAGTGDANDPTTWMGHFRGRLNRWRKIR